MKSWEGRHIDQATAQWGFPDQQMRLGGRDIYIWHHTKYGTLPSQTFVTGIHRQSTGYFSGAATRYGGRTLRGDCTRKLSVNDAGTINGWEWEGNNCPFAEMFEYSGWRYDGPDTPVEQRDAASESEQYDSDAMKIVDCWVDGANAPISTTVGSCRQVKGTY